MPPEDKNIHPAGKGFRGVVTDHGFSEAGTGADQVFVTIQNSNTPERSITAFLAMTDKAIKWTVKKLRACGFTGYDFTDLADGKLLVGHEVIYEVEHDVFEGETKAKVGWINNPDDRGFERSESAKQNAARFNDVLKQNPPQNTAMQEPAASPALADGDCPF
jgi:hypothetical protein